MSYFWNTTVDPFLDTPPSFKYIIHTDVTVYHFTTVYIISKFGYYTFKKEAHWKVSYKRAKQWKYILMLWYIWYLNALIVNLFYFYGCKLKIGLFLP